MPSSPDIPGRKCPLVGDNVWRAAANTAVLAKVSSPGAVPVSVAEWLLPMPYFALQYDVVDHFTDKRAPFRDAHLKLVRDAHARGDIFMAGPIGQPPAGALLIFQSETSEVAENFARADPYVLQGLVTRWRALPWTVVVESPALGRPKEP
jgi:uncharacterized protein YciI